MKSGLILTNAYYRTESVVLQASRLQEELSRLGVDAQIRRNDGFILGVENGAIVGDVDFDFVVYLDKDKYVSEMLEKRGIRLFNRHRAIRLCDDKMRTFIALAGSGIPMPKTLAGLLCYTPESEVSRTALEHIERSLGYPVIVKTAYGSLGKGVYKADNRKELAAIADRLKTQPHLFQQCISASLGTDIRVIVVGGKAVAAMRRTSVGDFRSNIGRGGIGGKTDLPKDVERTCLAAADILGLDFCGIDILTDGDKHYLCEVNSNAFFEEAEKATGVNIAGKYAEHICKEMYGDPCGKNR